MKNISEQGAREQRHGTTGWKCCHCGRPLPRRGYVWNSRYRKWRQSHKNESGYYCDSCADRREAGLDMYPDY